MTRCRSLRSLAADSSAAAAVEMALMLPVMISTVIGLLHMGVMFSANAGLKHAIGTSARYATIYPTPSDAEIKAYASSNRFATNPLYLSDATVTHGETSGVKYVEVSMTYTVPINAIFFEIPPVVLTESRRAFVWQDTTAP